MISDLASTMPGSKKHDFRSLVLSCNKDGMEALRKGQSKAAFEQFKYAEAILISNQAEGDNTSLLAVTCNNLGCYYKKVGKLHGALSYLRRALKLEADLQTDEVTRAGTHLNICAIFSKLDKHDKAVEHALAALELVQQRISLSEPEKVSQDDYQVLAISYHNVAVERDFMQQYEEAASAFQQGHQLAKLCLGEEHPLAITLSKNCEAMMQKSKRSKAPRALMKGLGTLSEQVMILPAIATALPPQGAEAKVALRQSAGDWAAGEEAAWSSFARTTLAPEADRVALAKSKGTSNKWITPRFALGNSSKFEASLRDKDQDMMDLVDAQTAVNKVLGFKGAANDYRPNRVIKGSTRTARVVRRTGLYNSTRHRDEVVAGRTTTVSTSLKSSYLKKIAAERIQRAWRAWYKYCQENMEWMTSTWICATMIQSSWRSYHVRRVRWDAAARSIQRVVRGRLVRNVLKKRRAAVTIQRHAVGMLTRMFLMKLQRSAVKIQGLIRGFLARRRVGRRRRHLNQTALNIQCAYRCHLARIRVDTRRTARNKQQARQKAATDMQRLCRGFKGRKRFADFQGKYHIAKRRHDAAVKLQSHARRDAAIKKVERVRGAKFDRMNQAATTIRKMWLGSTNRRRYKVLINEFARHVSHIITMQRFGRGFIVRLRMWREAIRAEEELWATLEIQRVWRGYCGRVAWESKFEQVWRREMAAAMIQRHLRGWLARTKVSRVRRRIARAEFERARQRFRAAQRMQALARGFMARRRVSRKRLRVVSAAVCIQRIARGHALRRRLWIQVIGIRATMIQAVARRFLVRRRRFYFMAKVICIQRAWRRWRKKPAAVKEAAKVDRLDRKHKAKLIQQKYRQHQENKELERIQVGV